MFTAKPDCCEEASLYGPPGIYMPCNKPAEWIVLGSDNVEVAMCLMCAYHNLKNRHAKGARTYDPNRYERFVQHVPYAEGGNVTDNSAAWDSFWSRFPVHETIIPRPIAEQLHDAFVARHGDSLGFSMGSHFAIDIDFDRDLSR